MRQKSAGDDITRAAETGRSGFMHRDAFRVHGGRVVTRGRRGNGTLFWRISDGHVQAGSTMACGIEGVEWINEEGSIAKD